MTWDEPGGEGAYIADIAGNRMTSPGSEKHILPRIDADER